MTKKIFLLFFLIGSASGLFSQTKDLKFDMKYQITSNDFLVVNDTLNHKIGKAEGSGSAAFSDESGASVKVFFIYDYTNGNGGTEIDLDDENHTIILDTDTLTITNLPSDSSGLSTGQLYFDSNGFLKRKF